MFTGEYECSIDSKGRLILPAKFRELISTEKFYITKGIDKQIDLYPLKKWEKITEKFSNISISDLKANAFKRFVMGSSQELEFDSQGRIGIPKKLKDYSSINKKVIVIGMGDKIEIWSLENYEEYNENIDITSIINDLNIDI